MPPKRPKPIQFQSSNDYMKRLVINSVMCSSLQIRFPSEMGADQQVGLGREMDREGETWNE